ncbi:hypothetical protein VTL71DRAFT_15560 [Oculimacula yallundae]|uniref:Major facilitator superfamily (MFS) profile domain-containing protein n=1 Tax=Oculimacula yallundae TaxID=86028 RepID=A0ABR4CHP7_9HELO
METKSATIHDTPRGESLSSTGGSPPTELVTVEKDGLTTTTPTADSGHTILPMSTIRWLSICVGLYSTAFLYGLDSTISAAVQGPVLSSLGNLNLLPWIGTGFMLGSVATIAPFGSLYSRIEIKWIYLSSILIFEVGSAICGAAPNMSAMAIGRVIAGIGGSGIYLGGVNYISMFVTADKRPFYTALIGTFWGLGAILGPVIGGAFAQSKATWRWAFYLNLVFGAVTAPIYIFWFPRYGSFRHAKILPRIKDLDWLGALLNAATFSLFVTSCTLSGSPWPWSSGSIITLWTMTGVITVLYVLQQWTAFLTTKENRIFPVWCLKSRTLLLLFIGTAGTSSILNVDIYYLPLFFQFTTGISPMDTAVRLLPFVCSIIFFTMLCGVMLPKFNVYAGWYVASGILAVVGGVPLMRITSATPQNNIYGFEVLAGAGCGISFQAAYAIALVKSTPEKAASVLTFINLAQLGGAALSLAIAGSVFHNTGFNTMQTALSGRGYNSSDIRDALGGGYSAIISDSSLEVRTLASNAIADTLAKVYILSMVGGAAVLVAGVLMRWEKVKLV